MSAPSGNILALFPDGHYLAEISNGLRAAHQDGRRADFKAGSKTEIELQASYLHDTMDEMHSKVVSALQVAGGAQ